MTNPELANRDDKQRLAPANAKRARKASAFAKAKAEGGGSPEAGSAR